MQPDTAPKETAPGAQDAQRAGQIQQQHFAQSGDAGLDAAFWAISEAHQATRTAGQQMMSGNPTASINALHRADRAICAAMDSLRGLIQ